MLEQFTKDEIKQIKKELKELGPDSDTKYFTLKNARKALRCSGIPNCYEIEMALYKICDFTLTTRKPLKRQKVKTINDEKRRKPENQGG